MTMKYRKPRPPLAIRGRPGSESRLAETSALASLGGFKKDVPLVSSLARAKIVAAWLGVAVIVL
jgi:hypothetical protein